jgi:UPF0176 protein
MNKICIAAFYHFANLDNYTDVQAPLLQKCMKEDILGTILLAREGINGTVAGSEGSVENILTYIRSDNRLRELIHKVSYADKPPFLRMKVRLKKEIVTMGIPHVNPENAVGTYIKPADWNALISEPDVILIDTRNNYEVEIGSFTNSINPGTDSFRELPDWLKENRSVLKDKKIAMFCTGGIRCEKSTAYLKEEGYSEVFHLRGGILKYLEEVAPTDSMWEGECFVFDERVSVGHNLAVGSYDLCHACRHAISEEDKLSPLYKLGISCPKCYEDTSDGQKKRFAERQKQMDLAKARNQIHIGKKLILSQTKLTNR